MTYEQFAQHIQQNGITLARTTEDFEGIPKGTKLWFGWDGKYIATYDCDTKNKNKEFGYNFDYQWSANWKKDGNYSEYTGQFELVEEKITNTIITNIKDKAQHRRVQEKLFEMGCEWRCSEKTILDLLENHIVIEDNSTMTYWGGNTIERVRKQENGKKEITADEFLGEEKPPRETATVPVNVWIPTGIADKIIELENKLNNTPIDTPKPISKGNKIMSIITNAFKSKEDKALEYFDLGTEKELSQEGRKEFVQFLFQTLTAERKSFLTKMVDAYKEEKK